MLPNNHLPTYSPSTCYALGIPAWWASRLMHELRLATIYMNQHSDHFNKIRPSKNPL